MNKTNNNQYRKEWRARKRIKIRGGYVSSSLYCKDGHLKIGENVRIHNGYRECKECHRKQAMASARKRGVIEKRLYKPVITNEYRLKLSDSLKRKGIKPPPRTGISPWNKGLKGFRAGEKSHLWRGGATSLRLKIRGCFEYRQWRTSIFKRDNYQCVLCGGKGRLNADHYKISFAKILIDFNVKSIDDAEKCNELWNTENGRTLCLSCHKNTPNYLKPLKQSETAMLQFREDYGLSA